MFSTNFTREISTRNISTSVSTKKSTGKSPNNKFNEWLAGVIDGDGSIRLSKKGYGSLEVVIEIRDKACLYKIMLLEVR